jgi:DNA polymerase IV (DinB-like DNA polymerase)
LRSRVIILADLDYFFAQCEEVRNPNLKPLPVVVCVYSGRTEESGVVSTANYVARQYGVKSGLPIFQAKKKLANRNAIFMPVDYEFYESISKRIMTVLRGYADEFEQVGIDEAYMDVTDRVTGEFEKAKQLAQEIKQTIKAQEGLTASIGVGPNKLIAKISSDSKKPDGLTVIEPKLVESFLAPLSVDRLIGVGKKTTERMHTLEIKSIGELAKFDIAKLREVFGRELGDYFHNASLGLDYEEVHDRGEAESISRIATLKQDTQEIPIVLSKAKELCADIHSSVIQRKIAFKSVSIIAIMTDLRVRTRSKTFERPTTSLETLEAVVQKLLEKFIPESDLKIRRIGVKVSTFEELKNQKTLIEFG